MSETKSSIQEETLSLILCDLEQLPYVREREREEAVTNYNQHLERGTGVMVNLGLEPSILLNGGERRNITAYTAVYRR